MKIDTFCHVVPKKFKSTAEKLGISLPDYVTKTRSLTDLDLRFRIMDKYEDYVQIITVSGIHEVTVKGHPKAIELVQMVNDELAELVAEYPDRFAGAVACLPLQDIERSGEGDQAAQIPRRRDMGREHEATGSSRFSAALRAVVEV
jgi:predicted TIM-barrel fold metal-dependent hydrolase